MYDLCINNGIVLTMDDSGGETIIPDGMVLIQGPRIIYVGTMDNSPSSLGARRVIDAQGGIIMPGLINSHTHAAMSLFRGLADDLPLTVWLQEHIFPVEKNLTAEAVYWGSMLACAEMIRFGVTSFCDMYIFAGETARAVEDCGLRAVVGEVLYDFKSANSRNQDEAFAYTESLIARYRHHPRIQAAVMPHAVYTCAPPLLERAGQLALEQDVDLHMHLAETASETLACREKYGQRPLAHLDALGLVGEHLWIAHGVDLLPEEMNLLARRNVRLSHCPESNMKLASGRADLMALQQAGVLTGLGSDGCASNNTLDMFSEMDTCAKLHKLATMDPAQAPAFDMVNMVTNNGAKVLNRAGLGFLRKEALADVIVVNTNQPHLTPMYNPYSHLVYGAKGGDVTATVCHGRVLYAEGQMESIDVAEIMAKAKEQASKLTGVKFSEPLA